MNKNIKTNINTKIYRHSTLLIKILSSIFIYIFLSTIGIPSLCLVDKSSSYNKDYSKKIYVNTNFLQNYIDVNNFRSKLHFFSPLLRMKHVKRWNLLKNFQKELRNTFN